jgi:phosphatidylserine decarboxylase
VEHPPGPAAARARPAAPRLSDPRWRPLTEGAPVLVPLAVASAAAVRAYPRALPVALLAVGSVALAFRDPEREIERRADIALAPADGQVMRVVRVVDEYWQTELLEVGIFLALWDVHVQRFPLDGTIEAQRRRAGGYWPAMMDMAVHRNNQLATYLRTPAGPCTVTQISGILAQRIVAWEHAGSTVQQGDRLGMIKFGSQVTLRLPLTSTVLVEVGQHVTGGVTPMASVVLPS